MEWMGPHFIPQPSGGPCSLVNTLQWETPGKSKGQIGTSFPIGGAFHGLHHLP